MGCIPAKVAGVERVVVATPRGEAGPVSDVVLAAASIAGADEVYAMGGAQAIAALAIGTETIAPVDVIAGPGNRYVQEAKRQLAGEVGIDGIAGPSELMVIAGDTADPEWMGLDLCSQAEHGSDGLLVAAAVETVILDAIEESVERIAADRGIAENAPLALVAVPETEAGVDLANAIAPEHLEIVTEDAELLAERVTTAGCVFVGELGATAFGDYAAGSNHVLPTGGAGRFQGPLGPERLQAPDLDRRDHAGGGPGARTGGRYIGPRRGLPAARRLGGGAGAKELEQNDAERRDQSRDQGDQGRPAPGPGRRRGHGRRPASASSTTCSTCSPATAGSACEIEASGDLETGAHHTTEDVGICLGQAIDEALGDRAGIRRYGSALVPMDEALGECAIDISGRPYCAFDAELPDVTIAGLRLGADRGVLPRGLQQLEDDPAPLGPLRLERAPHDRGVVQGVRASAARGRLDRPGRERRALHQGHPDRMTRIAILDYGMGNLRSVEKALERVGAEAEITADRERVSSRRTA